MKGGKAKISPEFLQKVKDAVNILEVVGEHVVLKKSGANHSGLCPFHSERSPSFSVHESKQLYHCYGCKKSGDLVTFVMEIHGISFPEAVEELAERARIALPMDWYGGSPTDDPETQRKRKEARERLHVLYKLNLFAMAFYRQQLKNFSVAEEYFRKRGVAGDLALNFRVGAAVPAWDALARHMTEKKAPLPQAVELGLIRPSTKSAPNSIGYFDLFRNRAMFPIIDMRGRVAGFGGRMMPGESEDAPGAKGDSPQAGGGAPKYMNSPESMVFQKSKLAFGLFQAQKHIREKDEVILVEGYFDVVALHAAGFQNVVATCGTSLTPEHLTLFKRFAKKVTILFDGDKAGIAATERAMEVGLENGLILHGASLPDGLDPDELLFDQDTGAPIADGKAKMAAILTDTQPLFGAQLKTEAAHASKGGPEALTQSLKKVAGWLGKYTDSVGRELWLEEVQRQLGVSRPLLIQAMGPAGASVLPKSSGPAPRVQPRPQAPVQNRPRQASQDFGPPPPEAFGPPMGGPAPGPRSSQPSRPAVRLSPADKTLLSGLAQGGEYAALFFECAQKLPPKLTVVELFDYPPAQKLVDFLGSDAGALDRLKAQPAALLEEIEDPQVRSTLTEAWFAQGPTLEKEDFKVALDRALGRLWARFSQRIKTALADAEAKKDAELHSELMKEYLDVQRKIKEFNSFYDEA